MRLSDSIALIVPTRWRVSCTRIEVVDHPPGLADADRSHDAVIGSSRSFLLVCSSVQLVTSFPSSLECLWPVLLVVCGGRSPRGPPVPKSAQEAPFSSSKSSREYLRRPWLQNQLLCGHPRPLASMIDLLDGVSPRAQGRTFEFYRPRGFRSTANQHEEISISK